MNPDPQDTPEDDEYWDEEQERAPRSIFVAGWFRAVLVLTVLAILVVVALPYLLNWFEPTSPRVKPAPAKQASTAPSATAPADSRPPEPAPVAPAPPPPAAVPAPPERAATTSGTTTPARSAPPVTLAERSATAPSSKRGAASEGTGGHYWVQLGSFKDASNAERLSQKVRDQGFTVEVARITRPSAGGAPASTYHVVRAGGFRDQASAVAARDRLRGKGYAGFVTDGVPP